MGPMFNCTIAQEYTQETVTETSGEKDNQDGLKVRSPESQEEERDDNSQQEEKGTSYIIASGVGRPTEIDLIVTHQECTRTGD